MSRFRRVLSSLAVSVMITDVVLIACAFAPEAQILPAGANTTTMAGSQAQPEFLIAGGGGGIVEPAFWKWLKRQIVRVVACAGCGLTGYDRWCIKCKN